MILMMATSLYTAGVHSRSAKCNGGKREKPFSLLAVLCALVLESCVMDGWASAATKWVNLLATNLG